MAEPLSLTELLAQYGAPKAADAVPHDAASGDAPLGPGEAEPSAVASVTARIRAEKDEVREALAAGRVFLRNRSGDGPATIHDAECPTIEHRVNRDRAWSYVRAFPGEIADASRLPGWAVTRPAGEGELPRARAAAMPELLSRSEVAGLRSYRLCGACVPDLPERPSRAEPGAHAIQLRNLGPHHLGRLLRSLDGADLGELTGVTVTLHFADGELTGTPGDRVILRPETRAPGAGTDRSAAEQAEPGPVP